MVLARGFFDVTLRVRPGRGGSGCFGGKYEPPASMALIGSVCAVWDEDREDGACW